MKNLPSWRLSAATVPIVDTDRLLTFEAYAQVHPNRKGGLGVRTSYIYQLLTAKKLPPNVLHLVICGVNFIYVPEGHPLPRHAALPAAGERLG